MKSFFTFIVNNKIMYPDKKSYRQGTLTHNKYLDAYLKKDGIINFLMFFF